MLISRLEVIQLINIQYGHHLLFFHTHLFLYKKDGSGKPYLQIPKSSNNPFTTVTNTTVTFCHAFFSKKGSGMDTREGEVFGSADLVAPASSFNVGGLEFTR
jgi:hypothetical protein